MSIGNPDPGAIVSATQAIWNATTVPIIKDQLVYESDTNRYKTGDGVSLYSALPYTINVPATTIASGVVRLATHSEVITGTSDTLAVTPAGLANALSGYEDGSLQIQNNGIPVSSLASTLNLTGLISVSENGNTANIYGNGPQFVYNNNVFPDVEIINLSGDLSIVNGTSPTVVQIGTVTRIGVQTNLVMPQAPTPGNYLVLFVVNCGQQNNQPGLLPGWTQIGPTIIEGATFNNAFIIQVPQGFVNSIPIYTTAESFFNCSATCHEITGSSGYALASNFASGSGTNNAVANTLPGASSITPILAYGAFIATDSSYPVHYPSFSNPLPSGTVFSNNVPTDGFDGEYGNQGQVVLYTGAPTDVSFGITTDAIRGGVGAFYGVIFYGDPSPKIINLIGSPKLTVNGNTINPTIQTAGMLEYSNGGNLGAYLTVENNGTILSSTVTTNNYTGGGVTLSENGSVNSINIPGISFSGTVISGIAAGTNVTGSVNSGILTINSTGGGGGSGGNGALVIESQENIIVASATALDFGPNFNVTQNGNTAKITTNAPVAFNGTYGSNLISSRVIGTTYTNNTNSTIFLSITAGNASQGNNFNLVVNGIIVSMFSEFTATYANTVYALVNPGDTYGITTNGGNWTISSWYERPISNGIAQGGAVELVSIQTISGAAEVDFTGLAAGYEYFITGESVFCSSTANTTLNLQFGNSGTWDTASNYKWSGRRVGTDQGTLSDTSIHVTADSSNWSGASSVRVEIHGDPSTTELRGVTAFHGGDFFNIEASYAGGVAVTQARLLFSSGNISGNFYLYRRSLRNVSNTQNITLTPTYSEYVNVASSRALGTVYTNTNSVPLIVQASFYNSNATGQVNGYVNGVLVSAEYAASNSTQTGILFVNPGDTYEFLNNAGTWTISGWLEKLDDKYTISGGTINLPAGTTFSSGGLTSLEVDSNGSPIITTATKLNFGSGFNVTASGNQATITNTSTGTTFGSQATFAVSPTYTDFTNVTGSRTLGTVYTNSTNLAIDVSIGGVTSSQYSKLILLVNGLNVSEIDTPVASGGDYGYIYGRVNPGDTYEASISYGSYTLLAWLEKPDTTYTVLAAPIQGGATAVAYNGSQTTAAGNGTTTSVLVPNCNISLQGGSVAQTYLISFNITHDGEHSNHFYVYLDATSLNTSVPIDSGPASGVILNATLVNSGTPIGQRWVASGNSFPVTIPGDGAVHTVSIYSAVADNAVSFNLYERYISAIPVGITNGQQVNGTPTNNTTIVNNGTSASTSLVLSPTITTRYILLSNSNASQTRSTYTLTTTAGIIEEFLTNWATTAQGDGTGFATLLLQAGQTATVTATTSQNISGYINCNLIAIPLPASNYVYSSSNPFTIEQAGTLVGTSGTINTGDDLTATISNGIATIGHSTIYPHFIKGGTLIATLNINTTSSFGPFTTAKFDTTNTFTPVTGHVYRIEFVFTSYNPNSTGGGNLLIRSGTNGYFVGDASNVATATSSMACYYTAGSAYTNIASTGSYYKSIPIPQRAQLILCCNASGNMVWGNFLSGSTPLAGPDTHVTLLGNAVQVGYNGSTGDTFTAFVYDMGTTP